MLYHMVAYDCTQNINVQNYIISHNTKYNIYIFLMKMDLILYFDMYICTSKIGKLHPRR